MPGVAVTLSTGSAASACSRRENAARSNACLIELSRKDDPGLHGGPARQRHRGAALPHPERRHGHAGRGGGGVPPVYSFASGPTTRCGRRIPVEARRGPRDRRRGTTTDIGSLRPRFRARPTTSSRSAGSARSPHARSPLAGSGRGHLVRPEPRSPSGGQRGLSPHRAGARLRRRRPHRDRLSAVCAGSSISATASAWLAPPGGGGRPHQTSAP